jgi:integrase
MSIKEYTGPDGLPLFMVRVDLRGHLNRNLRVTRKVNGIKSRTEAERIEKRLLRACKDFLHEKETRGATLGYVIRSWAKHSEKTRVNTGEVGAKLISDYRGTLKKWLRDHLGKPAYDFTDYMFCEVIRKMESQDMSLSQLVKFKRMVRMVFEYGIFYKHLPPGTKIPKAELKMKSKGEKVPEILTHQEIVKLIEEATLRKHPWRHVWAAALLTGMRSGELRALEWSDIDTNNRIVRVSKSVQSATGETKSTKAGYWRDVPISNELMRVIDELRVASKDSRFVFPRMTEWENSTQALILREFCQQVGLPSIRFHTLRACFATQLLRNGVEAAKVMKVCGWRDLSTMQHYVRLAGIEVTGVTDSLSVLPPLNFGAKVVHIRGF